MSGASWFPLSALSPWLLSLQPSEDLPGPSLSHATAHLATEPSRQLQSISDPHSGTALSQYVRNHVTIGGPGKHNRMTIKDGGRLSAASLNVGGNIVGSDGNIFEALPGAVVEFRNATGLRAGEYGNDNGCVISNASATAMVFYCGNLGNHGNYLRPSPTTCLEVTLAAGESSGAKN